MLSSSDCESRSLASLLELEPDAGERLLGMRLGYTEVPGSQELRDAVAAGYERVQAEDVLAVAAAEEGIFLAYHALLGAGDHAVIETPCYGSALELARSTGASVSTWVRRYEDGWEHDLEALERLLRAETRLIYLNSPHNPTGTQMSRAVFERLTRDRAGALDRAVRRRGLSRSRARRGRAAARLGGRRGSRDLARGGVQGARPAGAAHRLARLPRRRDADPHQGPEALYDDLLQRPQRTARRSGAAPPAPPGRREPGAAAGKPAAAGRLPRAVTYSSSSGCARAPDRSASPGCRAIATWRRGASGRPNARACCCCPARCTTSRVTCASASAGWRCRVRSSAWRSISPARQATSRRLFVAPLRAPTSASRAGHACSGPADQKRPPGHPARRAGSPGPSRSPSPAAPFSWDSRLDALGDHGQRQRASDPDDRFEQRVALLVAAERRDEALVDLEDVDRHALQLRERGVAGAEVVDRHRHAERLECLEVLAGAETSPISVVSVISSVSSDGSIPDSRERASDVLDEVPAAELLGGHVHRHVDRMPGRRPRAACRQASLEHPASDRRDQARSPRRSG